MIYVIMNSDVLRNQHNSRWWKKAIVFTAASALTGTALGACLGLLGSLALSTPHREAVGLVLAAIAASVGVYELAVGRVPLVQRNCEVPQRLMQRGPFFGTARYGVSLGAGFASRIGFALWYIVPVSSFLVGDVTAGAAIYGTYAAGRGAAPWLLVLLSRVAKARGERPRVIELWLLRSNGVARRLAAGCLFAVAITTAVLTLA